MSDVDPVRTSEEWREFHKEWTAASKVYFRKPSSKLLQERDIKIHVYGYTDTREDDSLVAYIASPFWAVAWCFTFGKFGKPLWTSRRHWKRHDA